MRFNTRLCTLAALALMYTLSLGAQTRTGLMGDLIKDVNDVHGKVAGLAKAMPAASWAWRPGPGVRSTGEVFMHIAADNYFMPVALGIAAPAETGITADYKTAATFEKKTMTRDQVIAEVDRSFAFLTSAMSGMPDAKLDTAIEIFGQKSTNRTTWISTATHLHEHLGQLIAYARSNKVTPPWSK